MAQFFFLVDKTSVHFEFPVGSGESVPAVLVHCHPLLFLSCTECMVHSDQPCLPSRVLGGLKVETQTCPNEGGAEGPLSPSLTTPLLSSFLSLACRGRFRSVQSRVAVVHHLTLVVSRTLGRLVLLGTFLCFCQSPGSLPILILPYFCFLLTVVARNLVSSSFSQPILNFPFFN